MGQLGVVVRVREKNTFAEFGYGSRKGFAPCDRDPLG